MQRKSVTKYKYISWLVDKFKEVHKENGNIDWYFDELVTIYEPLLFSVCKKVYNRKGVNVTFIEVKTRVFEVFFKSIIDYESNYKDKGLQTSDGKKFNYVYFSSYLKRKIPWDALRLIKPPKVEYDDLSIDSRHVELDMNNCNPELQKKLEYTGEVVPISPNFISLCRMAQKELKSDIYGDVMILYFGYNYKNSELAQLLNCSPQKISLALSDLKKFWRANKEKIMP